GDDGIRYPKLGAVLLRSHVSLDDREVWARAGLVVTDHHAHRSVHRQFDGRAISPQGIRRRQHAYRFHRPTAGIAGNDFVPTDADGRPVYRSVHCIYILPLLDERTHERRASNRYSQSDAGPGDGTFSFCFQCHWLRLGTDDRGAIYGLSVPLRSDARTFDGSGHVSAGLADGSHHVVRREALWPRDGTTEGSRKSCFRRPSEKGRRIAPRICSLIR